MLSNTLGSLKEILSKFTKQDMAKIAEKERIKMVKIAEKERIKMAKIAEKERIKMAKIDEKERIKMAKIDEKERNLDSVMITGSRADNDRNNKQRENWIVNTLNNRYNEEMTDTQNNLIDTIGKVIDLSTLERVEHAGGRTMSYDFQFTMKSGMVFNVEFKSNGTNVLTKSLEKEISTTPWMISPQLCDIAFSSSSLWEGETCDSIYLKKWYENGLPELMHILDISHVAIPSYKEYLKYATSALTSKTVKGFFKILKEAMDLNKSKVTDFVSKFTNEFTLDHADINRDKLSEILNKKVGNKDFWLIWFDKSQTFAFVDTRQWSIQVTNTRMYRKNMTNIGVYKVIAIATNNITKVSHTISFRLYPRWKNHNGLANPAWSIRYDNGV